MINKNKNYNYKCAIQDRASKSQNNNVRFSKFEQYLSITNKIMIAMVVVFSISYVAVINDLSIKGFILKDKKVQISELEKEHNNNELKVIELESYDHIEKRAREMRLVKVDKIDYIITTDEVFAKR